MPIKSPEDYISQAHRVRVLAETASPSGRVTLLHIAINYESLAQQAEAILRQQASLSTEHLQWTAVVVNLLGLAG